MPLTSKTSPRINYEVAGDGPRVLYISGTGGDLRNKPNVFDGPLSKSMQTLAYDQRGLGLTDKPEGPYSMEQYADDAAALLDELGWDRVHVIGVSFGGMVALNLALRHPGRINRLVLCCTSPGGHLASFPLHTLPESLTPPQRLKTMMAVNDTRRDAAWQAANPEKVEQALEYAANNQIADHATPEFKRGARLQLEARARHDVSDRLPEITAPTLICGGKYDGMAPLDNQEALKRGIAGSRLEMFEGGHLFMIQDKSAWPTIIEFLQ